MYDSESDNEAPEDVTFQQAREASKSMKRDQMSGDKIQKLRKREMNKARAAALKEQKVGSGISCCLIIQYIVSVFQKIALLVLKRTKNEYWNIDIDYIIA